MQQVIFIESQIEELEKQISNLLLKTNQVITTISGIGETLGAIIVSKIGDIYSFDSPSKLIAFAGLDVKVNQSGKFSGTKNKISKRGAHLIFAVLFGSLQTKQPFAIRFYWIIINH